MASIESRLRNPNARKVRIMLRARGYEVAENVDMYDVRMGAGLRNGANKPRWKLKVRDPMNKIDVVINGWDTITDCAKGFTLSELSPSELNMYASNSRR